MELRLPKEIIQWLDEVRGEKSRQGYIVNELYKLKNKEQLKIR